MADWRKKFVEDTAKRRTASVSWVAVRAVHSDVVALLVIAAAAVVVAVGHWRGEASKAEWYGLFIALPWILAVQRHNRSCKPCKRPVRGGGS